MKSVLARLGTNGWHQIWWQLSIFVLVCTVAVYASISFDGEMSKYLPESNTFTSTFNSKPSGYSGLFQLLGKVGINCRHWQFPYRRLGEVKGTLVLVGPNESLQDFEIDQLLSWVAQGNKLVYLDRFTYSVGRHILTKLGLDAHDSPSLSEQRLAVTGERSEFTYVPSLVVSGETRLDGGAPLLQDRSGILLTEVKHGEGQILMGAVPALGSNKHLGSPDHWPNFQFLANWLSTTDGDVFFDEICHGYSQATNVFVYLGRGPVGLIFLQVVVILLVALTSSAQRFGSTQAVISTRKISNMEFINGLANTFRRAKAADLVWDFISHAFRAKLCKALGVSSHEGADKLVAAWSQATGAKEADLESHLSSSTAALEKGNLTDEELVALVTACDKISEQSKELFATGRGKSH